MVLVDVMCRFIKNVKGKILIEKKMSFPTCYIPLGLMIFFLINHSSEIRVSCMMKLSDSKFAIFFGKKFRFPYSKYMVNFEAFH